MFPNDLEENQSITLTCIANVGSPPGNIQIWKISQYSDTDELIYTSNSTGDITDSCLHLINVTTTYTLTKKDNDAIFRCLSKNNLTQGPEPRKESSRISVICMYKYLNRALLIIDIPLFRFPYYKLRSRSIAKIPKCLFCTRTMTS